MKKIILIHGYTSSPNKKKYQIIANELAIIGADYSIPSLPGGEYPHSKRWLEIIDKKVKNSAPVVLVGHSLGTRAVLLYLDKFEQKVDTVILFSPFNNNFKENRKRRGGKYADFFEYSLNLEKIKKLANKFIVVHSKDDDSINYQQGLEVSKELGAELITCEGMGHFSGEENSERNAEYFVEVIRSVL